MSDEVTSTQSEIESVSESPSSTQSRSLTLTFSDSINVFLQEAHYEIDPSSVVDLIPISRTAIFSFLYSPPFGDGDRAGLVPLGVPCTTTDAVSGEVLAHPAMVEMSPTGAVIPSNWTVVVDKIGYYQVCAFQDVVKRWTLLEPARTVKVTPRLLGGITPESGIAGSFEFTIPVLGGSAADVVRLVPYGSSCRSDDASLYLSVSSVYDSTIVASGTIPLAGNYTACYRGFPQDIVPSEYVYGPIVVVGTASWYQVNTPPPIRVFKTLNVTVHGAGMTTSDAFTLSLDPSCSPSSSVGVNTPPQDGSTTGLSQLDVLLPLSRSGTVFLCYLSSAAYGNPYPLTPPIVVDAIYATGVTPFNETYASGTIVTLTFLGDLLSPENDRAELHVSGGGECDDPTPLRMRQSGGSFKVKVTAVTEYTVCYATNATGMTPISGASVRVVPRFYEPAEENLFFFGKIIRSEFVFRIIGYGLDPRRDVVWMQLEPPASNGTCSSSPSGKRSSPVQRLDGQRRRAPCADPAERLRLPRAVLQSAERGCAAHVHRCAWHPASCTQLDCADSRKRFTARQCELRRWRRAGPSDPRQSRCVQRWGRSRAHWATLLLLHSAGCRLLRAVLRKWRADKRPNDNCDGPRGARVFSVSGH